MTSVGSLRTRDHINKTCATLGETARTKLLVKNFIFDPKHKLLLCRNAKVGPQYQRCRSKKYGIFMQWWDEPKKHKLFNTFDFFKSKKFVKKSLNIQKIVLTS